MKIFGIWAVVVLLAASVLYAQNFDPALREDEAIERQKILRAADQLDLLIHQNTQLRQEISSLRTEVTTLKNTQESLQRRINEMEAARKAEREALIKEVASMMQSSPPSAAKPSAAAAQRTSGAGFEHKVEAGQSLWAISQAYTRSGNPVTVEEIIQANQLSSNVLRTGQVLFIPKK